MHGQIVSTHTNLIKLNLEEPWGHVMDNAYIWDMVLTKTASSQSPALKMIVTRIKVEISWREIIYYIN